MAIKLLSGLNIPDITAGSILKVDSNGNLAAAVAGTDYSTTLWTTTSSDIYRNSDVRIGTYQTAISPDARLHVFDYQTTTPKILIEDGNTGDASMQFKISTQQYTMGIDNSDSDKFILAASSALGTTNVLEVATNGTAAFQEQVLFNKRIYLPGDGTATREALLDAHGTRAILYKESNGAYWQVAQGSNQFEIVDAANGNNAKGNVMLRVSGQDADDNQLHLALNGGKVGIGTSSPGTELEIGDGTGSPAITLNKSTTGEATLFFDNGGNNKNWIKADSAESLVFATNNTANVIIKEGGSVGIGTDSPSGKLHSYISESRQMGHNAVGGDLGVISDNNSAPVLYVKGTGTADLVNIFDNTTEVFTILDGGNVGIGTASPDFKLDVAGDIGMDGKLYHNGDHNTYISFQGDTQIFRTGGTDRMTITNGGIGIGTASPAYDLDVSGNVRITGNIWGTNRTSVLHNFVTDASYEGNAFYNPETFNAFAGANKWSTITITNAYQSNRTTSISSLSAAVFQVGGNTWQPYFDASETDMVIEIDHTNEPLRYGGHIGIQWTNSGWSARNVKIEVYNGTSWTTIKDITGNQATTVVASHSAGSAGVQKTKFTLGDPNNSAGGYMRISKIFATDYKGDSSYDIARSGTYYLEKFVDNQHYSNIYPAVDSTYTLGTSTYYYSGVYTDKIFLNGTDSNTSSTTALVLNGTEVEKRTLGSNAFTSTDFVASAGDTMTGDLTIKRGHGDLTFLTLKQENTDGDLIEQKSFIDFTFVDANTNETPQVRIGAEVGNNDGSASSLGEEGMGAFVVYTNNADTDAGDAGTSLAERFRVDRLGNVGIGTASPVSKLHVYGSSSGATAYQSGNDGLIVERGGRAAVSLLSPANSDSYLFFGNPTAGNAGYVGYENTANRLVIKSSDYISLLDSTGEAVRIDGGNVGIGNTSPGAKLHVNGEGIFDDYITLGINTTDGKAGIFFDESTIAQRSSAAMYLSYDGANLSGDANRMALGSNKDGVGDILTVTYGGNVGIGTGSPSQKLDVNGIIQGSGSIRVNSAATGNPYLGLYQAGTEKAYMQYVDGTTDNLVIQSDGKVSIRGDVQYGQGETYGVISFLQSSTELAKIDQDGYMYATGFKTSGNTGFLKSDGSVDTTSYQAAGNYLTSISSSDVTTALGYRPLSGAYGSWNGLTAGSSGDWFPLFQMDDGGDGSALVILKTYAHDSTIFTVSRGFSGSNQNTISVLNSVNTPNSGYATVDSLRVRNNGWVEAKLVWSSGPTVQISVHVLTGDDNQVSIEADLEPTQLTDTVNHTVSVNKRGLLHGYTIESTGDITSGAKLIAEGKLFLESVDSNTTSTSALVLNSTEVEQRTLGSNAFTSTSYLPTAGGTMTGTLTVTEAALLKRYVSTWTNANTHDILYNGWTSDFGDYVYLKAQGNSTSAHGMLIVGDNKSFIGRSDVETGAVNSGLDQTWAEFSNGASKFTGQVSVNNRTAISVGHWSATNNTTGAIRITLPGSHGSNWSMIVLRITVYEYNSTAHTIYYVSGHDWTSGWYNNGVTKIGTGNKNIKLGYDSDKDYVILGETNSTWSYGHVTVDVMAHPSFYNSNMDITSGWDVRQTTDLSGITTQSVTNKRVLTTSDEGSGNGIDADTVDGIQAASFLRSDANDTASGIVTFTNNAAEPLAPIHITGGGNHTGLYINPAASKQAHVRFATNGTLKWQIRAPFQDGADAALKFYSWVNSTDKFVFNHDGSASFNGGTVWTSANDGASSGLDADTVDGKHASEFLTVTDFLNRKYSLPSGGGVITWDKDAGELSGTDRYIWIPVGDSGAEHINLETSDSNSSWLISGISDWEIVYYRAADSDFTSNQRISIQPADLSVVGYTSYVPNKNDLVICFMNGDDDKIYMADGRVISPGETSENPNGLATESYVTTQISNLVDSAPGTLDTLNELAAALGDDASFSTTMSTALGNRLRIDVNNQSLTSTQKSNGRTNLGLGSAATSASTDFVAVSGDYMSGNLGIQASNPTFPLEVGINNAQKVQKVGYDGHYQYRFTSSVDQSLTLTCGSYYQAEVIITAHQTNGGTYNNLYIRGIWSNNHTSHHWDEIENIGGLSGSSFTITNSQNDVENSGKLVIAQDYTDGSFAQLVVRVIEHYGTHSYTTA